MVMICMQFSAIINMLLIVVVSRVTLTVIWGLHHTLVHTFTEYGPMLGLFSLVHSVDNFLYEEGILLLCLYSLS